MITGGDLRQSRLDVGYKTFTISPCLQNRSAFRKDITEFLQQENQSEHIDWTLRTKSFKNAI